MRQLRDSCKGVSEKNKVDAMNTIRTWRDGTETFSLILHDGKSLKAVYAIHDVIYRQLNKCGYEHEKVSYSIRIVGQKTFVERWRDDMTYSCTRDRLGFRKSVPYEVTINAWRKMTERIRKIHSDSDDVVELYEAVKKFVGEYEVLENEAEE